MKILTHSNFDKKYKRLRKSQKEKFKARRNLFLEDVFNPILNNHSLRGKYQGYRSISIGGDLRALYKELNKDTAIFVDIDTHSNLYR